MCFTEVKRYQDPRTGVRRTFDQIHLCERSRNRKPCSDHVTHDSRQWILDAPPSPAVSLVNDNFSSPASSSYPATPVSGAGTPNIELREPTRLGRTASTKQRPSQSKRYSFGEKEVYVNHAGDKRRPEKTYVSRRKSVSQRNSRNSMDGVVVVDVGNPSIVEAPMPPPAVTYSPNTHRHNVPPPPPPAPSRPSTAGSQPPMAVPESPTSDRRRRPRPIVTGGYQAAPPPSMSGFASTSRQAPSFREVEPRTSLDEADTAGDNEFQLRQNTREQQRLEARRRQEEADRQLAEKLARKQKEEEGEELLAQLERDRFAERDRIRAEMTAKREKEEMERALQEQADEERRLKKEKKQKDRESKEEKRLRELAEKEDERRRRREQRELEQRRQREDEILHERLAQIEFEEEESRKRFAAQEYQKKKEQENWRRSQATEQAARQLREDERQQRELQQARLRAEQLERELHSGTTEHSFSDFARRRDELERMERDINFKEERLISDRLNTYDNPRLDYSASLESPRLSQRLNIEPPRYPLVDISHGTSPAAPEPPSAESWRERGERVIAASQAQAASRDLQNLIGGPRTGVDARGRYYWDKGVRKYY